MREKGAWGYSTIKRQEYILNIQKKGRNKYLGSVQQIHETSQLQ